MIAHARRHWLVFAIFGVFLLMFVVLLPFMGNDDLTRDHSTKRLNRYGATAIAELVTRVDPSLEVKRITHPLTDLSDVNGLLLIIDPERDFRRREVDELLRWLDEGGTAIIGLQGPTDDLRGAQRGGMTAQTALTQAFGLQLNPIPRGLVTGQPDSDSPLAVGVERVEINTRSAIIAASPDAENDDNIPMPFGTDLPPVLAPQDQDDLVPHLRASGHDIVVSFPHGEGEVFVTSDVELFSNALIGNEDNVLFVANLLWGNAPEGTIYFDEYHHGFGAGSRSADDVDPAPLSRSWWVAVAGVAIFLWGKGKRFGAPRRVFNSRRRTAMEHVEALANLFDKAGADIWALRKIESAFRHRIASLAGLPATAPLESLATSVSPLRDAPDAQCLQLLTELRAVAAAETVSRKHLTAYVRRISSIEERLPVRAGKNARRRS